MNTINETLKTISKWCLILLLLAMGYQQWTTFKTYQDKFTDPIGFTKNVYGKDGITTYENRLEEVKKMLSGTTVLNYVGESTVPNNGTREMHYALTQYYLAPNLLFRNETARDNVVYNNGASPVSYSNIVCDTILYNLYSSAKIDITNNYHIKNGWHIAKDFENGFILLTR
ncbi:MAG: hypothetical protein WBM13_02485 [Bacteroidia bacterium]